MEVQVTRGSSREATALVRRFIAEVLEVTGVGEHGPVQELALHQEEFDPPAGLFLLARDDSGTAVGCLGLHRREPGVAEAKRFWVHPRARGRGAGRALLSRFEHEARQLGAHRGVLDTHEDLRASIALYRSAGWRQTQPYKGGSPATHWFTKDLTPVEGGGASPGRH